MTISEGLKRNLESRHPTVSERAAGGNQAGEAAGSESTPRKAKKIDFVARDIILRDELIRGADIVIDTDYIKERSRRASSHIPQRRTGSIYCDHVAGPSGGMLQSARISVIFCSAWSNFC